MKRKIGYRLWWTAMATLAGVGFHALAWHETVERVSEGWMTSLIILRILHPGVSLLVARLPRNIKVFHRLSGSPIDRLGKIIELEGWFIVGTFAFCGVLVPLEVLLAIGLFGRTSHPGTPFIVCGIVSAVEVYRNLKHL